MTNREQVAWSFGFSEYSDLAVAEIVSEFLDASGVAYLDRADLARLGKWLGLDCDPETNNWGILEEFDDGLDTSLHHDPRWPRGGGRSPLLGPVHRPPAAEEGRQQDRDLH